MTTPREYRFGLMDELPPGPWTGEPDKVQWKDEATGLPCLAVRNEWGNWCGYAGVAGGHPLHGRDYDAPDVDLEAHGGITFAGRCQGSGEERGVCHVPEPGESDDVWWFGFDCGHFMDLMPLLRHKLAKYDAAAREAGWSLPGDGHTQDVYRTLEYVKHHTASLAKQLAGMSSP